MSATRSAFSARAIVLMLLIVVLLPFLPLLITRQWGWWEAWVYALLAILGFIVSRLLAARRHPDLLAERARSLSAQGAKPWDRWLSPLVGVGGGLVPVVAGVDRLLEASPPFAAPLKVAAIALLVGAYALGTCALVENRFFSGVVRIQTDRGHHVVTGGPYRWVRHPGYVGGILAFAAAPILLDSWWALVPALALTALLVVRTHLEDRTLHDELPGYREYAGRVRYRLLPGVW